MVIQKDQNSKLSPKGIWSCSLILLLPLQIWAAEDSVNVDVSSPGSGGPLLGIIIPWAILGIVVIALSLWALHIAKSIRKRYTNQ